MSRAEGGQYWNRYWPTRVFRIADRRIVETQCVPFGIASSIGGSVFGEVTLDDLDLPRWIAGFQPQARSGCSAATVER